MVKRCAYYNRYEPENDPDPDGTGFELRVALTLALLVLGLLIAAVDNQAEVRRLDGRTIEAEVCPD